MKKIKLANILNLITSLFGLVLFSIHSSAISIATVLTKYNNDLSLSNKYIIDINSKLNKYLLLLGIAYIVFELIIYLLYKFNKNIVLLVTSLILLIASIIVIFNPIEKLIFDIFGILFFPSLNGFICYFDNKKNKRS